MGLGAGEGNGQVLVAPVAQAALGDGGRTVARGVELALALHAFVLHSQVWPPRNGKRLSDA